MTYVLQVTDADKSFYDEDDGNRRPWWRFALENLNYAARLCGMEPEKARRRAGEIVERMGPGLLIAAMLQGLLVL